jgi:hypothetical protein
MTFFWYSCPKCKKTVSTPLDRDFVTAAKVEFSRRRENLIHAQQAIQDLEEALQGLPGGMQA